MSLTDAITSARAGHAAVIRCPAHQDSRPSLSVRSSPNGDGWVCLKCFAGCDTASILDAEDLRISDLGPPRDVLGNTPPRARGTTPARANIDRPRRRWPTFETPTHADLKEIAHHRGIGITGLRLAVQRGILRIVPRHLGRRAWVVTDSSGRAAQARRIDGQPWVLDDGDAAKAWSLAGTDAGWPIGLAAVQPQHEGILLCEGGPDLLAAHVYLVAESRERNAAAVAMLGSQTSIAADALHLFRGKRVRIAYHADEQHLDPASQVGYRAARRWAQQLHANADRIDLISFGTLRRRDGASCKDLNDALHVDADTFEHARILHALFP